MKFKKITAEIFCFYFDDHPHTAYLWLYFKPNQKKGWGCLQ
jgi:hypothetical protein